MKREYRNMDKRHFIFILIFFSSNYYASITRDPFTYSAKNLFDKIKCKAIGKVHLTDRKFAILLIDDQFKTVTDGEKFDHITIDDILDDSIIVSDKKLNSLRILLDSKQV